jgi:phosphoglycolate phosphatase
MLGGAPLARSHCAAMKYQLVIFDFDGTLADSFPWFMEVFDQISDRFHFRKMPRVELEALRSCSPTEILRRLGIRAWKMPFIASHMRSLMARDVDRITLFRGVDVTLRQLAEQGTALAVVSSNSQENVRRILGPENAALVRYYECGAALLGKQSKFRRVLARAGVPLEAAISIGDEVRDLEAARRVGIAFGAVSWGYSNVASLRERAPAEVFETFEDLAQKVA